MLLFTGDLQRMLPGGVLVAIRGETLPRLLKGLRLFVWLCKIPTNGLGVVALT